MLVWQDKTSVILKTKNPERILNLLPRAKQITVKGKQLIAVPHGTRETVTLRHLGFNAPAPIRTYYNWSGQIQTISKRRWKRQHSCQRTNEHSI